MNYAAMEERVKTLLLEYGLLESEEETFKAGFDSAVHGANTSNCHFRHFRTPALTRAWEKGRDAGNQARKDHEAAKREVSGKGVAE